MSKVLNYKIDLASFTIAIFPILSPYSLSGIPLTWIFGSIMCIYSLIFIKKRFSINILDYFIFHFLIFLISINGIFLLNDISSLIYSILGGIINIVIYFILWVSSDCGKVIKYANFFGCICVGFAIYQCIVSSLGGSVSNGLIPFLELNSGQGWVETTWGYRFNSLFSEPSYFAIYLLPIFSINYIKKKNFYIIIFGIGLLLSSSSLGIIGMGVIIFWQGFLKLRKFLFNFLLISILAYIIYCLISYIPKLQVIFKQTLFKLKNINSKENDIRFLGYIHYYFKYPFKELIFGVGLSQFQNYCNMKGISVFNYSNSFVITLLQSGFLGIIILVKILFKILKKAWKNGTMLLFIIFFMIMSVDYIIFSDRYFYLIYFIIYFNFSKNIKINNNLTGNLLF